MRRPTRWRRRVLGEYPVTLLYLCVMVTVIVALLLVPGGPAVCER